MSKKRGVPGNSRAEALEFQQQLIDAGTALLSFNRVLERYEDEEVWISSVRVRVPELDGQEFLAIVTARSADGAVVSFTSGATFYEALRLCIARLDNRSVKWQEDRYARQD